LIGESGIAVPDQVADNRAVADITASFDHLVRRARTVGGIVRPKVLAALRLIVSSKVAGSASASRLASLL
jgi:hypothetical protein